MREARFFYVPCASIKSELPSDEANHALKALRLTSGEEVTLIDGEGIFHRAEITVAGSRRCFYRIVESMPQSRLWKGHLHLAIAPTKMMERMEWLAEKATEIGLDELSFLDAKWSLRKSVKTERIEKIVVSAVKQSRKAWKPIVREMTPFAHFVSQPREGRKYIAHCHEEIPRNLLFNELQKQSQANDASALTVLIGPEGDFTLEEVKMAIDNGFESVSLGESRLRTETAGLMAVMQMRLWR